MVNFEIVKNVYKSVGHPVHRLILGEKMSAGESKVQPKPQYSITGTIGFMDFTVQEIGVPKRDAPEKLRSSEDFVKVKSFIILMVGIEPRYRSKRYFPFMVQLAEKMARKLGCQCIVYHTIKNEKVLAWAMKYGFRPFFNHAMKYL